MYRFNRVLKVILSHLQPILSHVGSGGAAKALLKDIFSHSFFALPEKSATFTTVIQDANINVINAPVSGDYNKLGLVSHHDLGEGKTSLPFFPIPRHLSQIVLLSKIHKELRLFLLLKRKAGAFPRLTHQAAREAAQIADDRTYARLIESLLKLKWIGKDSNLIFIQGWKHIKALYSIKTKKKVYVRLKDIQVHLFTAVIAQLLKRQPCQYLRQHKGSIASIVIAKCIGVTRNRVVQLKNRARKLGLIKTEHHFYKVNTTPAMAKLAEKYGGKFMFVKGGKVLEQMPDIIYLVNHLPIFL